MKRLVLFTAVLTMLCSASAWAQVQYSVGNFMRYGNGEQTVGGTPRAKEYIENQTNVRLFWDNFTVGFEYLYDDPPEFGPRFQGIRKRYVEFAKKGLELRAGDFYTLYGKGLAMNLFENRGINYDTRLDGIRGTYRNRHMNAIFAMGTLKYYDLLNSDRIEQYSVKSGHMEVRPFRFMRIGGSIVSADGDLPMAFGMDEVHADIPEFMMSLRGMGFDVFVQRAWKRSSIYSPTADGAFTSYERDGDAWYGSVSYTADFGLGMTFEYKDYRFDVVGEEERDPNRPGRMLPMQNPPIVHKEHYFTLLSRNPHVVDFNDEIGMQMDVFYSVSPSMTINLNGAVASRHDGYTSSNGFLVTHERDVEFMPTLDEKFSPFYELYGEVEWYFTEHSYVRAAANRRYDAPYEANQAHEQSSWTFPIRIEYMLDDEYSIGAAFEQQFYHDSFLAKPDYFNEFVSLTFAKAAAWSATLRMEYTTDEADQTGKDFWRSVELAYRLGNDHLATISYGTERGGLICTSGICREILPFDGVRISLLSQL
ncbi:MAG: hypothetical protein C0600_05440 [Ignavibacteria bacterium]|nr:MAG: hypothetical protein C0600_05440 [Ignavibacteria bacterium]